MYACVLPLMALVCSSVAMAAGESGLIPSATGTNDLRLMVGISPPIESGTIRGIVIAGPQPPFSQSLKSTSEVGPKAGIRYLHGFWFDPDWGFKVGVDAVVMRSQGQTKDKRAVATASTQAFTLDSQSAGIWIGPTSRISIESLDYPADFCEFELLLGGGPAQITAMNAGSVSSAAMGWRYGASVAVVFTAFSRWQVGFEAGYEAVTATDLKWNNTRKSEVTAAGVSGGIFLGHRW